MKALNKVWHVLTVGSGIYAVYNHLRLMNQAKEDLFHELSPDQQEMWIKVFGEPGGTKPKVQPLLVSSATSNIPAPGGTVDQIKAGT